MAIITISRGTRSAGQDIADRVAEKLGYRCLSRHALLLKAAEYYGTPLRKLTQTLEETPRFLDGFSTERAKYLALIRAALCREIKNDNVVYHGLAGHLLLGEIPHLIKVRIAANMEFRIKRAMEFNRLEREEAIKYIKEADEKRVKWTKLLYHVDWNDSSLYCLVIYIDHLDISDASDIICYLASLDEFKTTPESQKTIDDLVLSTEVRAAIAMNRAVADAELEVFADNDTITLGGTVGSFQDADKIREIAAKVPGVKLINSKMKIKYSTQ